MSSCFEVADPRRKHPVLPLSVAHRAFAAAPPATFLLLDRHEYVDPASASLSPGWGSSHDARDSGEEAILDVDLRMAGDC